MWQNCVIGPEQWSPFTHTAIHHVSVCGTFENQVSMKQERQKRGRTPLGSTLGKLE